MAGTEKAECSAADEVRVANELYRKFKRDGTIKFPPDSVTSFNQPLNTRYKLFLCNLQRWRLNQKYFDTLDFRYSDKETTDKYDEMEKAMTEYYKEMLKFNIGFLQEKEIKNGMLIAVNLGDGIFRRAVISETAYEKPSPFSSAQTWNEAQIGYFPKYSLHLMESNTSVWLEPQHKLMYMVKQFVQLPYQTMQFFLQNTEDYHGLIEFRDALCSIVSEEDELEAECHVMSEGVLHATLWSTKFSTPLNQVLREMTVSALKRHNLPPVGKIFSAIYLSHIEPDATVYLQFGSYGYNLFKKVEKTISRSLFYDLQKKGPYRIDTETIYLSFWDTAFYRVKIHDKPESSKAVLIYFIDYGNYDEVDISDLVPCALVSPHFEKFKPQAIRAKLANVASIDVDKVNEAVDFDKNPEVWVETYREATDIEPAVVEILVQERDRRGANKTVSDSTNQTETEVKLHDKLFRTQAESKHKDKPLPSKTGTKRQQLLKLALTKFKDQDELLPIKPNNKAETGSSKKGPEKNDEQAERGSAVHVDKKKVTEEHKPKRPFRLSELALSEKFAQVWEHPILSPIALLCARKPYRSVPDIQATNWAFPSEIPIRVEVGATLDILVLSVSDNCNFVIQPAHAGKLVADIESQMSKSGFFTLTYKEDYENKAPPSKRSLVLEKGMYYALYDEASYPGLRYFRVRLIGDPPSASSSNREKVEVILIDYGQREAVEQWRIFYLEPRFCQLPPQAAFLQLCEEPSSALNQMHIRKLEQKFRGQRVLVKVFSFKYGSNTGRCLIQGDIYKNFPFGSRIGLAKSQTLSAAQAVDLDIEKKFDIQKFVNICNQEFKAVAPAAAPVETSGVAPATTPVASAIKGVPSATAQVAVAGAAIKTVASARAPVAVASASVKAVASATAPVAVASATAPVAVASAAPPAVIPVVSSVAAPVVAPKTVARAGAPGVTQAAARAAFQQRPHLRGQQRQQRQQPQLKRDPPHRP